MVLITMKMTLNKPNMTMMLGKYNVGHIRMREVIYKLFKDLEGLPKHRYTWPQNEIKEHFAKHHLKSKPYYISNLLTVYQLWRWCYLFLVREKTNQLHSPDVVTFS